MVMRGTSTAWQRAHEIALRWFRCDLRLTDNTAFHVAADSDVVVCIFIFDPGILKAHPSTGSG